MGSPREGQEEREGRPLERQEKGRQAGGEIDGFTFYREGTPPPDDRPPVPQKDAPSEKEKTSFVPAHQSASQSLAPMNQNASRSLMTRIEDARESFAMRFEDARESLAMRIDDIRHWFRSLAIHHDVREHFEMTCKDVKRRLRAPAICGLKRRIFLLVLAGTVVALILILALGVGLGVGLRKKNTSHASESGSPIADSTTTITSLPSPTSSSLPTNSTSTGSSKTSATTTGSSQPTSTALVSCPAANNTQYQVPESDKRFLRICGVDFRDGKGQTQDIAIVWTSSIEDCMNVCAGSTGCTGCSWGPMAGDTGSSHRCWLKSHLKKPTRTQPSWEFAILF